MGRRTRERMRQGMRRDPLPRPRQGRYSHVRFTGGLDTETPRWNVNPGKVQVSLNYEMGVEDGYRDIQGFERFDGRKSPSSEKFYSLPIDPETSSIKAFEEFGGISGNKIVDRKITSYGTYVRRYPVTTSQQLHAVTQATERLEFKTEPEIGVVGKNSTQHYGAAEGTVVFTQNFLKYFTESSLNTVNIQFDYVLLYVDYWILETLQSGTWTERGRLYSFSLPVSGGEAGDDNIDSIGTSFTTYQDGGWRNQSFSVPKNITSMRLRPSSANNSGTLAFCCVESHIRNVSSTSAKATVIGTDIDENKIRNRLIISNISNTWKPEDRVFFDGAPTAEITTIENEMVKLQASSNENLSKFLAAAADSIRSDIRAVPGLKRILGIWMLGDAVFAVRNNATNTAQDIYKSTATGWTKLDLGYECDFSAGGSALLADGATIVSGATSTKIRRVVLTSGSFGGGDAAGRLILDSSLAAGSATVSSTAVGTVTAATAISLSPLTDTVTPRYETIKADFGGGYKLYGVDGVNSAFEFDGSTYVPIRTAMASETYGDKPKHIIAFQNHLFLSFGRTVQFSGIGDPYKWTIVTGAGSISTEGDITALLVEPGEQNSGALAVFNRNRIFILYGTSSTNFAMTRYREEVGAYERTVQEVTDTIFLDDRGLRTLQTVQAFGNFQHATISEHCRSFLQDPKRFGEDKVVGSCLIRQKNQYRIFFEDGFGLMVTFRRHKLVGIMPINYDIPITYVYSSEDKSGLERSFISDDKGFVYEMEAGTSFDGEPINSFLLTHYHFPGQGTIGMKKRFLSMIIEAAGTSYASFQASAILNYNQNPIVLPDPDITEVISTVSAFWDATFWDEFYWDGRSLGPGRISLRGNAENIAVLIRKTSDHMAPLLLSGMNIRYAMGSEER